MSEEKDRKEFVEPELVKYEEALDKVTMIDTCPYPGDCATFN